MTNSDLRDRLSVQVRLLKRSAGVFDDGDHAEALNLATRIRVLVHDTRSSTSLLTQLGVLERMEFMDTSALSVMNALPATPKEGVLKVTVGGLHVTRMSTAGPPAFVAPLDDSDRFAPFTEWWERPAVQDLPGNQFSRQDLVRAVANNEGGAHVDVAGLDPAYEALARANSIGFVWSRGNEQGAMGDPVPVSIRQIAHEVLRSVDRAGLV